MKRRRFSDTFGGLDLIEQSVHTLRVASPGTLLCYYLGAAPFVLGALWFFSEMSRSGLAGQHLVGGALGLTALFVWMKLWQSLFALSRRLARSRDAVGNRPAGLWARATPRSPRSDCSAFSFSSTSASPSSAGRIC